MGGAGVKLGKRPMSRGKAPGKASPPELALPRGSNVSGEVAEWLNKLRGGYNKVGR